VVRVLYTCIVGQHDPRLVAVAALICLFACYTAVGLFSHASEAAGPRRIKWLAIAAVVFGAGVWATHFVAELAYRPGMPVEYAVGPTAASLVVAVSLSFVGMTVAAGFDVPAIGGAIIGIAVGAMHYVGMAALHAPADLVWNPDYVAASIAIGVVLCALALRVARRESSIIARAAATVLLVGGICGLHFVAMSAVWLVPDPTLTLPAEAFDPLLMAVAVAAVSGLIIAFGLSGSLAMDRLARHAMVEAERLRASQEHLARAQRIARIGSVHVDLVTRRVEWSDETYRIFGLPRDTTPCLEAFLGLVHPDDAAVVGSFVRKLQEGATRAAAEFRLIRPDGSERMIHDETEVLEDGAGRPALQITTIRDITEERAATARQLELESQLQHSQRLKALGTLAGGIAHDLNNTLVPIVAISKMMIDDMPPDDENRIDLKMVLDAGEHARRLVQQIIAFSRQHEVVEQPIDLAGVTRDALGLMRASIPATIQIVEKIDAVPATVGDAALLQQVVVNLMTNAAQAIGERTGVITIRLARTGEAELRLSITDTGCGMDEATVQRVFEPFFTTRSVGAGTGLGLSVAHGIVQSHGGRIEVRSKPGDGAEFVVHLPVRGAQVAETPAEAQFA
jgi:PAS domain S-box-containing protein